MTFEKNVGHRDSQLRTVAAAVVIVVAMLMVDNPWLKIVLALVSAALAVSAYFHSCYLYKLLGLHTLGGKVAHTDTKPGEPTPEVPVAAEPVEPAEVTSAPTDSDKVA
jgi:hypothetical protein